LSLVPSDGLASDPVARARAGDRAAFDALYARYARLVHGVLLSRLSSADAEDQVQEVFLVAWQKLDTLRDDQAFGAWIVQIARRRADDAARRRRSWVRLPPWLGRKDAPTAEARQVLRVIRDLPPAYRETLILRLVEGMTGPEIARATGLTPGSVRVNLHRGMKLLRERLGTP